MRNTLLPPNAPALMQRIERACEQSTTLPVPLRPLWDPSHCPVNLLPWLAWSLSVDRWDPDWPAQTKRQAIRQAHFIHRHKGTISALKRAVEPLGYIIRVIEWWQSGDEPGTFRLDVDVQENGITEAMYQELERLIADAKPVSRHMTGLSVNLDVNGQLPVAVGSYDGDILTVYAYTPETLSVSASLSGSAGTQTADTLTVSITS
ncbi:Phage tail protein (Tail_P2_I) [Sodalis glossinidius str. 'morsitans']|uniref:Phage tail protein n=1 Tax=Sodalis glossinidius (strain morsitans) TaxID=343509 RepID=Q2NU89_SODGM|nr:phage tail protein I [Sodalis glossinidius]BAE74286.1 putative phage tail protein [Sodalis glossinidius str. 'morsitans']CRL44880.1 Phage tail protein (Tail_P2_I) [Sodalis glossinidius str. 'morsitans']